MEPEGTVWDPCATLSTFLTLEDISSAQRAFQKSSNEGHYETAVLKLLAETREKGYKRICMPLTTEIWSKRWSEMCLLPAETEEQGKESSARTAEAWRSNPGFRRDEVTIKRLGASWRCV